MSTNYYLITKEIKYRGKLGENIEIIDNPYFGYSLHLSKVSYGWLPVFEFHRGIIESVADIKKLYESGDFEIRDEYDRILSWDEYVDTFKERYDRYHKGEREMLTSHVENKENDVIPITYIVDDEGYEFMDARFS